MDVLKYNKVISPFAILINIPPLLGAVRVFLDKLFIGEFDLGFYIVVLMVYLLGANLLRLSVRKKTIYVKGNTISHRSMFGWKRIIVIEDLNIKRLVLKRDAFGLQNNSIKVSIHNFIYAIKVLFNLNHGNKLVYDNKIICSGLD